jgi:hypothetical protein
VPKQPPDFWANPTPKPQTFEEPVRVADPRPQVPKQPADFWAKQPPFAGVPRPQTFEEKWGYPQPECYRQQPVPPAPAQPKGCYAYQDIYAEPAENNSVWMFCWLAMVMVFECMFAAVATVFNTLTAPVLSVKQVYEPTDESSYHPLVKALVLYLLITVFAASPITKIVCVVFIAKYVRQHLGR